MKFNWNAVVAVVGVMENDSSIPHIEGDGYKVVRTDEGYCVDIERGDFAEPTEVPVPDPTPPPAPIPPIAETPAETPTSETPLETPAATGETAETPEVPADPQQTAVADQAFDLSTEGEAGVSKVPAAEETPQPTGTVTTPESETPEGDSGPVATG